MAQTVREARRSTQAPAPATRPAAPAAANATAGDVMLMPWEKGAAVGLLDTEPAGGGQPEATKLEGDEPAAPPEEAEAEPVEVEEGEPESGAESPGESEEIEDDTPEISASERKDAGLRLADYTRKTQELAAQRKQIEAEQAALRERRSAYDQRLEGLVAALDEVIGPEPDWDKLRKEKPETWHQEFAAYQIQADKRRKATAELERVRQEQYEEFQQLQTQHFARERERLLEAIPELKEPAESRKLVEYATGTYGWTPQDLDGVTDHRLYVVLRKAMLYDQQQARGEKEIPAKVKAAKVLKPGSRSVIPAADSAKRKQLAELKKRAERSGRLDDVTALYRLERELSGSP